MTTLERTIPLRPQGTAAGPSHWDVLRGVFLGELVKLRTVRSTPVIMIYVALSILGTGVASAAVAAHQTRSSGGGPPADLDPTGGALAGIGAALIGAVVLGFLSVTADYGSGVISASVAAVPRRTPLVLGKVAALVAVVFPISLGSTLLAFVVAKVVLSTVGISISVLHPGVGRTLVGAALYLTVLAILTAGLGWLVRSTAGTLGVWLGLWILPSLLVMLLPPSLAAGIEPYLPSNAGRAVTDLAVSSAQGWGSLAIFALYALALTLLAVVVVRRRDV